jgi:hypothetical protein
MSVDKRSFKKMFPHLIKEIESGDGKINIDSVRTDAEKAEEALHDKFRHYSPTVVDFIRRCDTEKQAESIIDFMEKRGELTAEQAKKLKLQLKKEGVRSFGPKKEDGYYFKQGELC